MCIRDRVKETEPSDITPMSDITFGTSNIDVGKLEEPFAIAKAIKSSEYTWRTLNGLSKETKIDKAAIESYLEQLKSQGYVDQSIGTSGRIYSLTALGLSRF